MPEREVRYCTTEDGVRIAYCVEGEGPPLVLCRHFVASFSLDHLVPTFEAFSEQIGHGRTLVWYDTRGTGLSQREATDFSGPALVLDIDAVVRAARLKRFALWGTSMSGPRAIAYAAQHPQRVTHLILDNTFARFAEAIPNDAAKGLAELSRTNWKLAAQTIADMGVRQEVADPGKRQMYAELALQIARVTEQSAEGRVAASMILEAYESWDVGHLLGQVRAKTLVFHHLDNAAFPVSVGRKLAADIPGAVFVPLEGEFGPVGFVPDETDAVVSAVNRFLPKRRSVKVAPTPQGPLRTVPAPAPQPSSFASGRYVVSRLLGEGGQKIVFLARDTQLNRDVAVALLKAEGIDDASLARLKREAQALAHLEAQPHIVAIYDIGEHERRPFIVCEYLAGGTLEQELARAGGALPAERAVAIARDVCHALVVAHGGDIIHRDIKPSNIWLTGAGSAKLGDFGLATALDRSRVTQAGTIMGTAAYMAPEQALGGEIDQRSDLYSLGCVLYEMLTGRPPFLGDTAVAVVSQHINASPVAPSELQPGLPRAVERLTMQMLAKAPEDRPQTAAEVLTALEAIA